MSLALIEASKARKLGEVPVGAVVIDPEGIVIGGGYNRVITDNDPTAHAEIIAIKKAAKQLGNYRLLNCYLVVTLEPCLMCVGAIAHARLAGVVYGTPDPKAGSVDSCMDGFAEPFLNHHPWSLGSILSDECRETLQEFFSAKR